MDKLDECKISSISDGTSHQEKGTLPWDALGCPECLGQGLAACLSLKFCRNLQNHILELYKQNCYAYLTYFILY